MTGTLIGRVFLSIGFFCIVLFSNVYYSQIYDTSTVFIETNASFIGGKEAFNSFITQNIIYPSKAKKNGISGVVYILFIVETDGTISNVIVESGPKELIKEAERVVRSMPKWTPSMMGDTPVREKIRVPIEFTL